MHSLWNNQHVAKHIEGASRSHFQMHLDPRVHAREQQTKACIVGHADAALEYLRGARRQLRLGGAGGLAAAASASSSGAGGEL